MIFKISGKIKKAAALAAAAAAAAVCAAAFAEEASDAEIASFLGTYGWEVRGECIEKERVIIPKPFDLVYKNYNELQKEAGLDLEPYMGMTGVRYTYEVINYPYNPGEPVRANVIVIDGKCVGGDICTVSLGGFMHSLEFEKRPADD